MLMSDNSALSGHPWHHYLTGGAASLLQLLAPFLVLGIVCIMVALARWVAGRVEAYRNRPRSPATAARAVGPPVLASDVERDRTTQLISHAVGEGRLSFEEAGRRIDAALRSRHRHELEGLVTDLPAGSPRLRAYGPPRVRLALVAAAVALAAIVVQAAAGVWALWPVAVTLLGVATLAPRRLPAERGVAVAATDAVPELPWKV
jgi:Domain of unknown function (DUF1707)